MEFGFKKSNLATLTQHSFHGGNNLWRVAFTGRTTD